MYNPTTRALLRHLQHQFPDNLDIDCHGVAKKEHGTWTMSYWAQFPATVDPQKSMASLDPMPRMSEILHLALARWMRIPTPNPNGARKAFRWRHLLILTVKIS